MLHAFAFCLAFSTPARPRTSCGFAVSAFRISPPRATVNKKDAYASFWPIAEAERFELSVPFGTPPFQGGGINRYPTPPFFNHGKELPL